ncbi:MAG: translocase-like protein, partial [Cyanobacteria bacterium RYN_339]|nr:translocase-like protein [Cyanobacteria bacterium RYN_339]
MGVGITAADALFLKAVGAAGIPWVYLASSCVMFAYVPLNARLTERYGASRVLDATLATLFVGNVAVALGFMAAAGHPAGTAVAAYTVKVWNLLFWVALANLFWNFAEDYFALQQAKRLNSLIAGGGALGAVVGGTAVKLLTSFLHVEHLFLVWSGLVLAAGALLAVIRRTDVAATRPRAVGVAGPEAPALTVLRQSPFARALSLLMVTGMAVFVVADFQCMQVFGREQDAVKLAGILGYLYAASNALVLLANFFLFNRFVLRYGVVATAAVTPPAYVLAFLVLAAWFDLPAAVALSLVYRSVVVVFQTNSQQLLLNAVPAEARKDLRMLVKGIGERIAMALAAGSLVLFAAQLGPRNVSWLAAGLALACLGLVARVAALYPGAVAENVQRDRLDFSPGAAQIPSNLPEEERFRLWERVRDAAPAESEEALAILWRQDRQLAVGALAAALEARGGEAAYLAPAVARFLTTGDEHLIRRLGERDQVPAALGEVLADHHLVPQSELEA